MQAKLWERIVLSINRTCEHFRYRMISNGQDFLSRDKLQHYMSASRSFFVPKVASSPASVHDRQICLSSHRQPVAQVGEQETQCSSV
jgi:hypothetical protein